MTILITKRALLKLVPYSHTHILRLERAGKFPKRIKPHKGPNGKAFWSLDEVEDWIYRNLEDRE